MNLINVAFQLKLKTWQLDFHFNLWYQDGIVVKMKQDECCLLTESTNEGDTSFALNRIIVWGKNIFFFNGNKKVQNVVRLYELFTRHN